MRACDLRWGAALLLLLVGAAPASTPNSTQPFVPTDEWQPILPGQSIPAGLHVRINMQTGNKEAKLLDSKDNNKSLSVVPVEDGASAEGNSTNNTAQEPVVITKSMEDSLKKIASSIDDENTVKQFKSFEELKSEFKEMNLQVKTDMEIMHDLFNRYNELVKIHPVSKITDKLTNDNAESKYVVDLLDILIDLEYLAHQVDNAVEFARLNGFEKIIYPLLNSTDFALRGEALKVMMAALQNNLKVQVYALDSNALEILLKILSLDNNEYVRSKAVRVLSCLTRNYPAAQIQATTKRGLDVFQNILSSADPNTFRLKVAIIVLLDDLMLEHKLVKEFHTSKPEDLERVRLYNEVNLTKKLSNPMFCDILSRFLVDYLDSNITDMEYLNKLMPSLTTFARVCRSYHFKDKTLLAAFHKTQDYFQKNEAPLKGNTEAYDFYANIVDFIENYIDILSTSKFDDEL